MSVRVDRGIVHLSGRCGAEDAETLLVALQEDRTRAVDVAAVERLHLAVAQVLLAARPVVTGTPDNAFLGRHVVDLLQ